MGHKERGGGGSSTPCCGDTCCEAPRMPQADNRALKNVGRDKYTVKKAYPRILGRRSES